MDERKQGNGNDKSDAPKVEEKTKETTTETDKTTTPKDR